MHEKYTTDRDGHWDGEVTCPDTHKVGDSTGETTSDGIELIYCEQCGREISGELNDYPDYYELN